MFKLNAMKKTTLMILLSAAMLQTQAQDYLISFAGVGDTTVVTTVNIDNLTSGDTITLRGGDTLHLTAAVGIDSPEAVRENVRIYPNPMIG